MATAESDNNNIRLHQMLPRISTLGPYIRMGVWVQGCHRRCPGCIAPGSRSFDGGKIVPISTIVNAFVSEKAHEGITISGGEPFLQAFELCKLIDLIRVQRDCGIILYTGYTIEELQSSEAPHYASELLRRIDLLIDGPYMQELNDDASLRGSSNQRLILLSERYKKHTGLYGIKDGRIIEIKWTQDGFFVVGIPSKQTVKFQWPER